MRTRILTFLHGHHANHSTLLPLVGVVCTLLVEAAFSLIWQQLRVHRRISGSIRPMQVEYPYITKIWPAANSIVYTSALADVDPVGVNPNVTFDEVGGLDERKSCNCYPYSRLDTEGTFRHKLFERDDRPPTSLSRTIPAFWSYATSWFLVPLTTRNR